MISFLITARHLIMSTSLLIGLIGCGGGDNSEPVQSSIDKEQPFIITTFPASGEVDVNLNVILDVTFNEEIQNVSSNNIKIYPYESGFPVLSKLVLFNATTPFEYISKKNKLRITTKKGELKSAKTYQITVANIKDIAGNEIEQPCTWLFAIGGAGAPTMLNNGNNALCSRTAPLTDVPTKPRNVTAVPNNNFVTLTWDAPLIGEPDYYKIDVISDNQITSRDVDLNFSGNNLTIVDRFAKNNIAHIYRVIAHNTVGDSIEISSNVVVPRAGYETVQPSLILKSENPVSLGKFGLSIAVNSDGLTMAVGEPRADSSTTAKVGKVQIYNRATVTDSWTAGSALFSNLSTKSNGFGAKVLFSPDGKTLAVYGGDGIQLFSKTGLTWNALTLVRGASLTSDIPAEGNAFGISFSFSPDSNTIAVGESYSGVSAITGTQGRVLLFNKTGSTWNNAPINLGPVLVSDLVQIKTNHFGSNVAFSPDGEVLAVASKRGGLENFVNSNGKVQLFSKVNGNWKNQPTLLVTLSPKINGGSFGVSMDFSADNSTLAIGEYFGSINDTDLSGIGTVHLFIRSGLKWDAKLITGPILSSDVANQYNAFGEEIKFSPNSKMLVVSEALGDPLRGLVDSGMIQVFNRIGNDWKSLTVPNTFLISDKPFEKNYYGSVLEFNSDGSMLYVGDPTSDVNALIKAGSVKGYETLLFNK